MINNGSGIGHVPFASSVDVSNQQRLQPHKSGQQGIESQSPIVPLSQREREKSFVGYFSPAALSNNNGLKSSGNGNLVSNSSNSIMLGTGTINRPGRLPDANQVLHFKLI